MLGLDPRVDLPTPLKTFFAYLAKFGPSLAGIAMVYVTGGARGLRELWERLTRWRVPAGWYGVALLGPGLLWVGAAVFYFARTGVPDVIEAVAIAGFPALFLTKLFLGGGLGEELGWRGYLLPLLGERVGDLRASLWIGLAWGLWHAPAFVFPGTGKEGDVVTLLLFTIYCTALSVIFTWVYRGARESLLVVMLLHAALNSSENTLKSILPALQDEATFIYGGLVLVTSLILVPRLRRRG